MVFLSEFTDSVAHVCIGEAALRGRFHAVDDSFGSLVSG
ncbi:hypothetical protein PM01_04640 [Sulfitobacter pontiacus 3SOLIMAR09]|nr:hypothetical protein PM01_04640 [Sulfitobacter pontiacus 3SOLIMAR09]